MDFQKDKNTVKELIGDKSLSEIEAELTANSINLNSKDEIETAAYFLGLYINKLNYKFGFPLPVFPKAILPVNKQTLKNIGFEYSKMLVLKQNNLKRYQEDVALFYTNFQNISESQWKNIINDETLMHELLGYDSNFLPNFEKIDIDIPDEFKNIINEKYKEKEGAAIELHNVLKKTLEKENNYYTTETQNAIDISNNFRIWLPWYFKNGFYTLLTAPLFIFIVYCLAVSGFGAFVQAMALLTISKEFGVFGTLLIFSICWFPIMVPAIYYSLMKNFPGLWIRGDTNTKMKIFMSVGILIALPLLAFLMYHALGIGISWLADFALK